MKKKQILSLVERFAMPVTLAVLGLILLFNPDSASAMISAVISWILVLGGIVYGIAAIASPDKRVSRLIGAAVCIGIGSLLLSHPLWLAKNIGRFLAVLLAIEGGDTLRQGSKPLGAALLVAALILVFAPLTASRLLFIVCGVVLLLMGIAMFIDRYHNRYLTSGDDDDPNVIDAL